MSTRENVVIIGGGLAGAKTAEALREQGYTGAIDLVAAEDHLPYERPPLSKGLLAGQESFEDALVHPASWYSEQEVSLHQGTRATSIEPAAHRVRLDHGSSLAYGALVLATGSQARRLQVPGADAAGVHYLRTIEDAHALRTTFGPGRHLAIIGGGWIGLEAAAAARQAGTEVTVIESHDLPLQRVLGPEVATVFARLHQEHGVHLVPRAQAAEILLTGGAATGIKLASGQRIAADAVLVGIGAIPQTDLAHSAGLDVDDGVLVDATLRTSEANIYAVGDIARQHHPVLGRRIRVEHWAAALNQPAAVAATVLGHDTPYTDLPYFFTDQYDLGMEYIGHAAMGSYHRVIVRGELDTAEFVAFWIDSDSRILAAMNVNVWDIPDQVKPLITARRPVDLDRLADPQVPLTEL